MLAGLGTSSSNSDRDQAAGGDTLSKILAACCPAPACRTHTCAGYTAALGPAPCEQGSWSAGGTASPCTPCSTGLTTDASWTAESHDDAGDCRLGPGWGYHGGQIVPCPEGVTVRGWLACCAVLVPDQRHAKHNKMARVFKKIRLLLALPADVQKCQLTQDRCWQHIDGLTARDTCCCTHTACGRTPVNAPGMLLCRNLQRTAESRHQGPLRRLP